MTGITRPNLLALTGLRIFAAGLPALSTHALRCSYVSLSLQVGVSVKVISERVGHSTTRMTQDVYQQVFAEMHRAAPLTPAVLFGVKTASDVPPAVKLPPPL